MSSTTEVSQEILTKIRDVLNLANNAGTEGEAAAASAAATRLLQRYNLTLAEVEEMAEGDRQALGDIGESLSIYTNNDSAAKSSWLHRIISALQEGYFCKAIIIGKRNVAFIGRETNAQAARETFNYLYRVLDSMSEEAKEKFAQDWGAVYDSSPWKWAYHPTKWRKSWLEGAAVTVSTRLRQQFQEFMASSNKTTSIVLVSQQEIASYIEENVGQLRRGRTRNRDNYGNAYSQGLRDGENVRLGLQGGGSKARTPELQ